MMSMSSEILSLRCRRLGKIAKGSEQTHRASYLPISFAANIALFYQHHSLTHHRARP